MSTAEPAIGRTGRTESFGKTRELILGVVGSKYKPIQNSEAFEFMDGLLDEFGARYETAGSVFGGKRVWMLAHLPQQAFKVTEHDTIEPYVLLTNPHDGSGAGKVFPTTFRPVCANQFFDKTLNVTGGKAKILLFLDGNAFANNEKKQFVGKPFVNNSVLDSESEYTPLLGGEFNF